MKKIGIVIIVAVMVLCLLLFASCKTSARWQDQYSDTNNAQDVSSDATNPSAKYIVYVALDSSGAYIVKNAGTTVASYAVIGYTGLLAELVIPAEYQGKNVTRVIVLPDYTSYECSMDGAAYTGDDPRLANNPVVTSIVFGSNVVSVGAGVCAGMVNLNTVRFTASSAVTLGHAAFSACNALETVTGSWTPASGATPFLASGYTPQ